jgi:hypothetical protein
MCHHLSLVVFRGCQHSTAPSTPPRALAGLTDRRARSTFPATKADPARVQNPRVSNASATVRDSCDPSRAQRVEFRSGIDILTTAEVVACHMISPYVPQQVTRPVVAGRVTQSLE